MSKVIAKPLLAAAAGCALAVLSAPSLAAGTWDFSICNGSASAAGTASGLQTGGAAFGDSYACAATGSTTRDLTVTAWGGVDSAGSTGFQTAYLSSQGTSGFGVASQSEGIGVAAPNHAMDNNPTTSATPDLILLSFASAVVLDKVTLGWTQNDADITVMAYTGASAPTTFLKGKTASTLASGGAGAGWTLVQNAGDATPDSAYPASSTDVTYSINGAGVSSSYWLVSAYNSNYGGGVLDTLTDYAKLFSVATRDATVTVAEPASMALVGLALLGLATSRRRARAAV